MARTGKVAVSITADPAGLERGLRRADTDLDRFGKSGSRSLHGLKTAALAAGAAITTGVVVGLKHSVDAAIEAEKSQAKLEAQLKALGISYKQHAGEIDRVIQKTSELAGVDDEDLQDAFTNVVRTTGDVGKALEQMTLVADLARAKHLDVAKAGDIVAKVMGGNTGILSRYGITLKDGATATEALATLQKKFAGQAEAYGKTTAGAQDRFRVATENLEESVGKNLLPVLTDVATAAADFVGEMQSGQGTGGAFARTLKDIWGVAKSIVGVFVDVGRQIANSKALMIGLGAALAGLAIQRTVSKVRDLAEGFAGLTKAGKFGALAGSIALVSAALLALGGRNRDTAETARDLADALDEERAALKRVRDLDLDAAQAKVQARASTLALKNAEDDLRSLRKSGTATVEQLKQAENNVAQARIQAKRDTRNLTSVEDDANQTRREAKEAIEASITALKAHGQALVDGAQKGKNTTAELGKLEAQLKDLQNQRINIDVSQAVANIRTAQTEIARMIQLLQQANALPTPKAEGSSAKPASAGAGAGSTYNQTAHALELTGLRADAGQIGAYDAAQKTVLTVNQALKSKKLGTGDRLRLLAERRAARQVLRGKAYDKYVRTMNLIDKKEAAGDFTQAQADAARLKAIDKALKGGFGKLTADQTRLVKADFQAIRKEAEDEAKADAEKAKSDAAQALQDETSFKGTAFDDAALVQAQIDTPDDVSDDAGVLEGRKAIALQKYLAAKAAGDRDGMALWGGILSGVTSQIEGLKPSETVDQKAQTEQANVRAAVAQSAAAIAGAELATFRGSSSIGYGGPVIVFKVGETEFARATVQSLNQQPAVTTSRTALGV